MGLAPVGLFAAGCPVPSFWRAIYKGMTLLAGLRPCLLPGILASVLPLAHLPPFLPLLSTRTGACLDTALDSFPVILAQVYMWQVSWLKRRAADTCPLLSTRPAPTVPSPQPSPTAPAVTDSQSAVPAPAVPRP
jgi:hypothetical protein